MKRRGHLINQIADLANLRSAFVQARRGKTKNTEVLIFTDDLDKQLLEIRSELLRAKLKEYAYRRFAIFEPKQREICAGPFRLNVIHHAIMNTCGQDFEQKQIFDSYACRKGKGTHSAVKRAQQFARKNDW